MAKKRVVVLASGSGSNFQAIIDFAQHNVSFEIVGLIVNVPEVKAIERAKAADIPSKLINHKDFANRTEFEAAIHDALLDFNAELVVCAGFMRILQPDFVSKWDGRMINIHPSLLPKYKGLHTHQRAIDAGDKNAGCTVHFVNAGVDEGAIIGQAEVEIIDGDDADTLAARVIIKEHILYPICVEAVAAEKIILKNGICLIDNQPNIIRA